jgi:hypothetical protein
MTRQELLNSIIRVEEKLKREIMEAEERAKSAKEDLKKSYAASNAKFKKGDIVLQIHPAYGPVPFTIIRVESISTTIDGTTVVLVYRGREMHPDLTESYGVSGAPRYESIYDYGDKDIRLLTMPMYESYVVVNADGKEFPTKSYIRTLDIARSELASTGTEFVIRYGITASGERQEIQKIPNVSKYFRR